MRMNLDTWLAAILFLRESLTMKCMGAVESDSVKSAVKLKISCTRPVKECQKLVSELCMGRNKTVRMASMRVMRQ